MMLICLFYLLLQLFMCSDCLENELLSLQQRAENLAASQASEHEVRKLFHDFVIFFDKGYDENTIEYEHRLEVFQQSLARQRKLNKEETELGGHAKYGLNQFSDLTTEEFENFIGNLGEIPSNGYIPVKMTEATTDTSLKMPCTINNIPLPKSKNWLQEGMVTSVKNQGSCGSCWAFSGAEQVESYWAIKGHPLMDLSVQELLSCAPSLGCGGGDTCAALAWLLQATYNFTRVQLVPANDYPYVDDDTECDKRKLLISGARISAVCGCTPLIGSENWMLHMVAQRGPLAVNVNAVLWHDYIGGIIQHHCTNQTMNHAVQVVGYNLVGEVKYWLVRNSWGPKFGENGYLRLKYGENTCGVAQGPSYVEV